MSEPPAMPDPVSGLPVNESLVIPRSELRIRATKSGGPGGQHVNTSSSRIEVEWNVRTSAALDDAQRWRLLEKLATRIDGEGDLRVVASDSRSQAQNRKRAEERLASLVRAALVIPKARRRTKPTRASKEARLGDKKRRSDTKRHRRWRDAE